MSSTKAFAVINLPATQIVAAIIPSSQEGGTQLVGVGGGAAESFSVDSVGRGSFTGLNYTVAAHAKATITVTIQTLSLTTADVDNLNSLINTMVNAATKEVVDTKSKSTSGSANLSFWDFWCGGSASSNTTTTDAMKTSGLKDAQISALMDKLFDLASKMNNVAMILDIDNTAYDYEVSGDIALYTVGGQVTTSKGTTQFRMLADKGTAGENSSPTKANVVPLS